jgi:hypothetical protein
LLLCWLLVVGFDLLALVGFALRFGCCVGCCLLFQLLAVGCWLLAVGCWLLLFWLLADCCCYFGCCGYFILLSLADVVWLLAVFCWLIWLLFQFAVGCWLLALLARWLHVCWLLAVGCCCCFVAVGCFLLAVGCWLLAVG